MAMRHFNLMHMAAELDCPRCRGVTLKVMPEPDCMQVRQEDLHRISASASVNIEVRQLAFFQLVLDGFRGSGADLESFGSLGIATSIIALDLVPLPLTVELTIEAVGVV